MNKKFNFTIEDSSTLAQVILNNGYHPTQDKKDKAEHALTIMDAVASTDLGPLIPQAMVEIMVEAQDPIMTLTPLLDRISWENGIREFKMPAMGVFDVERVAEGMAYPEKRLQLGGSMNTATIDKWGVALAFTEEAIQYSRWDIVGMHVREAGRAFARRRETGVADFLRQLGQVVFDNRNPLMSRNGVTRGRDEQMALNGTITMDDLFDMWATLLHTGYTPNIMMMHPLTWLMFIKDPNLRAFTYQSGGGVIFGGYTGSAVNRFSLPAGHPMSAGSRFGGLGDPVNGGQAPNISKDFALGNLTSAPTLPSLLPFPMQIIVTPYMYFDPRRKLTDIVMADRAALGAIVVAEDLTTDSWDDIKVDISYMKFRERYGFMIKEEGMGIAVAKNIKVDTNYWSHEPARPTYDSLSLPPYVATTPVV